MFCCGWECEQQLSHSAKGLLARGTFHVQHAVQRWVHEEMFGRMFPGAADLIAVEEFIGVQKRCTLLQPFSQLVPQSVVESRLCGGGVVRQLTDYHDRLRPLVEKH